jgi:uncharacterized protein (DUF58 family)
MRQRVMKGGVLYGASLAVVAVAAFASANNLLFLILAAMVSTLLVAGFISRLSLAGLEIEFSHPEHISARRQAAGKVIVRNLKWVPSFSVTLTGAEGSGIVSNLYYPSIPGGAALEDTVDLLFPRRGIYRENDFHFSTAFPFGFIERRATVPLSREILVYPSVDPTAGFEPFLASLAGDIESWFRGRGHDFYRIRPYVAFESARHVDWKATAHTGELQVREFAKEEEQTLNVLLDIDAASFAGLPADAFDRAVDDCSCLVWMWARRGGRLRFYTQEFRSALPEHGDVWAILKYLATVSLLRGRVPPALDENGGFQVVFSARPERLPAYGWAAEDGPSARVRLSSADASGADGRA